jgi:hypothetical protein
MSQRDIIDMFVTGGNPWKTGSEISKTIPSPNNVYIALSRLADIMETRACLQSPIKNEYRLKPKAYRNICIGRGICPSKPLMEAVMIPVPNGTGDKLLEEYYGIQS